MITFIHTADVHFGMENYGRIDSKTGIHSRLLDFKKAFDFCIDTAIEQNIDFFLFSGDAYKTTNPSPTQQKLLMQCLLRLHKNKIPVVIVIGNHDNPLSFGKAHSLELFGDLPLEGFHVIAKPEVITLNTKSGPVQVFGMPWPTRNTVAINDKNLTKDTQKITEYISSAVTRIIKEKAAQLDPTIPTVFGGHLTVSSGIFSGSEKRAIYGTDPIIMPSDLAIEPFDYVGLGHLHRYQNLNKNGYPAVVYSGSIERIDFGERKEKKGFCLVTIKSKGDTSHTFIPTPSRPFIQIEVHLQSNEDHTKQILQEIKQHEIKDAVIKLIYHVPDDELDQVDTKMIQFACSRAWYLVGIFPIRKAISRKRRSGLHVNMSFESLLQNYFTGRPEYKGDCKKLTEKALTLQREIECGENNSS